MILQVAENYFLKCPQALMMYLDQYRVLLLPDYRRSKSQLFHLCESGVETFSDILIRRVRELVDHSYDSPIPGKAFSKNVCLIDMSRKPPRAFDLYPVVKYAYVYVVGYTVVAMQYRVGDDFVKSDLRILDGLQPLFTQDLDFLNKLLSLPN